MSLATTHNHLAAVPCADCKASIWAGVECYTLYCWGYARDTRNRALYRETQRLCCVDCRDLRREYYSAYGFWANAGGGSLQEWAARLVEEALEWADT